MLLHYRSVFRVEADPADAARGPFGEWLARKKCDGVDLSPGRRTLGEGLELEVAEGPGTQRFRLRTSGWPLKRMTTLTAHREPAGGPLWLWLEREYEVSATDVPPPRMHAPALVRSILKVARGLDGLATLTTRPQKVTAAGLDHLIDVLCDHERQVPAVVVSRHPRQDPAEWTEIVRDLTADLAGVAAVYELDKEATDLLDADAAWAHHKVFGGAIRTYLPGVDPASPADAARHRVLTAARILENQAHAKALLTRLPWDMARARPLPEVLQRAEVSRAGLLRAARDPRPEDTARLAAALSEAIADADQAREEWRAEKSARRLAEERAYRAERRAQDEILDHDATREELSEALDRVRRLSAQLVAGGLVERAHAPVPERESTPRLLAVTDLRLHLRRLERVRLDVDWTVTAQLDDDFKAATWAAKAWRALRALDDYAAARAGGEFDRDFYAYCQQPPPGRTGVSANAVAITESDDTRQNRRYAAARLFTVPAAVHPEGRVHMWAHVKLDSAGRTAPRIHFYDDTAGPTGLVHVGYIGPHLPNRQS